MRIHEFDDSGEAYDASQYRDDIHDGDVLYVRTDNTAAVLCGAWPVIVQDGHEPDVTTSFHAFMPGADFETHEGGRYSDAAKAAREFCAAQTGEDHDCPRDAFLADPITQAYGVGSEMVSLIACPVCDAREA